MTAASPPPPGPLALDHQAIAARVPHAGPMCLLDAVVAWDEQHIECRASGHSSPAHPLAQAGRLPATAAVEYAAQAMALHGRLVQEHAGATAAPRRGFLAGLRSVRLHCRWIDADAASLTVRVSRYAGDEVQVLYDFEVAAGRPVASGRAVVVLDAAARAGSAPNPSVRNPSPDDASTGGAVTP
jgi:predicted hotdog family 3-hydroxylacyl-ACP dehydratase